MIFQKPLFRVLLSLVILATLSCNKGSSGSDDAADFIYTPDSMDKLLIWSDTSESYTLNFNGAKNGNYAVIYKGTIDDTGYLGIALSSDPTLPTTDANYFNLKIYFPHSSSTIPGNYQFGNSLTTSFAKVVEGPAPTTYQFGNGQGTGTLEITITLIEETDDYTTYRIQQSNTIQLSGTQLDSLDVVAIFYGSLETTE